jgi:hypothetical protein
VTLDFTVIKSPATEEGEFLLQESLSRPGV